MNKFLHKIFLFILIFSLKSFAQKTIGIGTDKPNPSAVLELKVENSSFPQGLLLPRLTTSQRNSLASGTVASLTGMAVYDIEEKTFYTWDGSQWKSGGTFASISGIGGIVVSTSGNSFTIDGGNLKSQWISTMSGIYFGTSVGIGVLPTTGNSLGIKSAGSSTKPLRVEYSGSTFPMFEVDHGSGGQANLMMYENTGLKYLQIGVSTPSYFNGSGNFGIGTITPNEKFTVQGNSSVAGIGYFGTIIGNNLIGASGSIVTVDGTGKLGIGTLPALAASQWTTSGTNIYYNQGNVGIGTQSPTINGVLLQVVSSSAGVAGFLSVENADATSFINLYSGRTGFPNPGIGYRVGSNLNFGTLSSQGNEATYIERMRLTNVGDLGIGTETPEYKLHVNGGNAGIQRTSNANGISAELDFRNAGAAPFDGSDWRMGLRPSDSGDYFAIGNLPSGTYSPRIVIDPISGNVGINISAGSAIPHKLSVQGNGFVSGTFDANGAVNLNSTLNVNSTVTFNSLFGANGSIVTVNGLGQLGIGPMPSGDNFGNHIATSQIKAIDGTATAPAYSFSSNSVTGFYLINTNILGISTNSTQRMLFDGFGHTVFNQSSNGYTNSTYGAMAIGAFAINPSASDAPFNGLVVSGNVGIGTSTPGQNLVVVGNQSTTGIGYFGSIIGNNLAGAPIGSIVTVDGVGKLGIGTLVQGNNYWEPFLSNRIYTTSAVGVGTTSPIYPLHVVVDNSYDNAIYVNKNVSAASGNQVAYSAFFNGVQTSGSKIGYESFVIPTANENVRGMSSTIQNITNTTHTGILTASYSYIFNNANGQSIAFRAENGGSGVGNHMGFSAYDNSDGNGERFGVHAEMIGTGAAANNYAIFGKAIGAGLNNYAGYFADGKVYIENNLGIGTTSPSAKLDVNGTVRFRNLTNGFLTVDGFGNLGVGAMPSSTSWKSTTAGVSFTDDKIAIGTNTVAGTAKFKVAGDGSMGGMVITSQSLINPLSTSSNTYTTLITVPVYIPQGTNTLEFNVIGSAPDGNGDFQLDVSGSISGAINISSASLTLGTPTTLNVASLNGWQTLKINARYIPGTQNIILHGYTVVVKN